MRSLAPLFVTVLLGLLFGPPVSAQQDPQAAKVLDAMSAKYAALKSFQSTFTQTLENPAAKLKQNVNGDLTVSGSKYHLVSSGKEIMSDGVTTWTFDKEQNEVTLINADESGQELSPPQMFTFNKGGYNYQLLKTLKEGGILCDQVELSPENKENDVYKMQLLVGQADKSLKSVKTFQKNGTSTTMVFKSFKPNVPVTPSTFAFDKAKHPGVQVVDLREPQTEQPQATATPSGNPPVGKIPIDKLRLRKPKFARPRPDK